MSALSDYILNSAPFVVQLQLLEFSHPNFSTTYRIVRNAIAGVTVTHEGGAGPFTYDYYPLLIKAVGSGDDLDQSIEITLGDLGQILPAELDNVAAANAFTTKPTVAYREYRSDDLTAPIYGPLTFQIDSLAFSKDGAAMKAKAAAFNQGRIGLYYTDENFETLSPNIS